MVIITVFDPVLVMWSVPPVEFDLDCILEPDDLFLSYLLLDLDLSLSRPLELFLE